MSIEEYDEAYEELRVKHETLTKIHDDLLTRHEKLSVEHEELKVSYKELECSLNEKVSSNTPSSHDGSTCIVKVDTSSSCHDLLNMPGTFSCDDMYTLEAKLLKENEKLKIDNVKLVDGWKKYTKGYEKANEIVGVGGRGGPATGITTRP